MSIAETIKKAVQQLSNRDRERDPVPKIEPQQQEQKPDLARVVKAPREPGPAHTLLPAYGERLAAANQPAREPEQEKKPDQEREATRMELKPAGAGLQPAPTMSMAGVKIVNNRVRSHVLERVDRVAEEERQRQDTLTPEQKKEQTKTPEIPR